MKKPPVTLHAAAGMLAVLLSGCGRGLPDAVPEQYERIGEYVAIRADGASFSANAHSVPALELFENGDYALFKLSTDCQGNLATDAGMRFAADGAIRDDVSKRAWTKSETLPALSPIAEKLCELAATSRSVADPGDDRAVLKLLFGEAGSAEGAVWYGPSLRNKNQMTLRYVRVLTKGRFSDGKRQRAFVITTARDPECPDDICNSGIIGAAMFEQSGNQWLLRAHDTNVYMSGSNNVLPRIEFVEVLTPEGAAPLLTVRWRYMNAGYGVGDTIVYGLVAGHFKKVLEFRSWVDDTGSNDCTRTGECEEYETLLKLGEAANPWPELVTQRIQAQSIDDEKIYRFNGKDAYVEVPNSTSPKPVASFTTAQIDRIAAMRPIVIDSVRSAWKNDPAFSSAQIRALNLQPETNSSYRGKLAVRLNGQERDFAMRVSISADNQYAWQFIKN